jgi:deazaflavin-dependent oxidoreductase (nitroreductase family)
MGLLGETVRLTHYGRKSGKPFDVTIWFASVDGALWIGSMNGARDWVRNLRANGKATLDFGNGPQAMRATWVDDAAEVRRYDDAITAKYPLWSRIIALLVRGDHCAFHLEVDGGQR